MSISILLIVLFSALFLFSWDWVESRVGITLVGVALVIVAFFGAVGFALLIGVKISVTIAWTLPFVILGLGVDDMVRIQALSLSSFPLPSPSNSRRFNRLFYAVYRSHGHQEPGWIWRTPLPQSNERSCRARHDGKSFCSV
jgi:hypothetical protein